MRWLWTLCGIAFGLVLAFGVYLLSFHIGAEAGCWRWDPEPGWRAPAHCRALSGVLQFVTLAAFGSAIVVPLVLAARKRR